MKRFQERFSVRCLWVEAVRSESFLASSNFKKNNETHNQTLFSERSNANLMHLELLSWKHLQTLLRRVSSYDFLSCWRRCCTERAANRACTHCSRSNNAQKKVTKPGAQLLKKPTLFESKGLNFVEVHEMISLKSKSLVFDGHVY